MSKSKSRTGMYAVVAIIVIAIIVVGAVYVLMNQSPSNATQLTLYAGETSSATYGFGDSSSSLQSNPGPTINLKVGTTYKMTVHNVGTMPHSWEISSQKAAGSVLFSAQVNSIAPGASASVTFTPNQAGNFYYVCTIPGHISLGMWGNVVVTS